MGGEGQRQDGRANEPDGRGVVPGVLGVDLRGFEAAQYVVFRLGLSHSRNLNAPSWLIPGWITAPFFAIIL